MNLERILWRFNRLKSMNLLEVVYRLKVQFFEKNLKIKDVKEYIKDDIDCIDCFTEVSQIQFNNDFLQFLPKEFAFELYGSIIDLETIDWNKDYVDNFCYPHLHISRISLNDYGNREVKNVLEMHRLHFLVDQSIRFSITRERKLLYKILRITNLWLEKNPFAYGMGWISPTIVAKRLISLLFVWNILDLNNIPESKGLRKRLIDSFNQHIYYITNTLSLFSSANNHLTAELVGAFSILKSCSSNLTKDGDILFSTICKKLEALILEQNFSDGKNKECGFGYQYQVADWFFLAGIIDNKVGEPLFSESYFFRLHKMFLFFRSSFDNYGNFFDYGDRDNFHVLPIQFESSQMAYIQFLESGAFFFNDPSLIIPDAESGSFDFRNRILFERDFSFSKRSKNRVQTKNYIESGHIVSWFKDDNDNDVYFNFRSGYFGYLSIAAHSHSDLNSFYLSINGQPIFIDPGTYCYRKDPEFREYFRSALAHNTISVNNQNHALAYGYNHWHNKKSIKGEVFDYSDNINMTSFSSVCSFPDGTDHIRHVCLKKDVFELTITDELVFRKKNDSEGIFSLHLHPNLSCQNNQIVIDKGRVLKIISDLNLSVIYGQDSPFKLGWYSPDFSVVNKTEALRGSFIGSKIIKTKFTLKNE